jgi:hypothetical protein
LIFWRDFSDQFGAPGLEPSSYWQSWLGHWCHVRPSDIGDMTAEQLYGCYEFMRKNSG